MPREKCPYVFCSAILDMVWLRTDPGHSRRERLSVPIHTIKNPIITGACPAGLMWLPLGEHEAELLTERAQNDGRTIQTHIERVAEGSETDPRGRHGGMFPITAYGPDGVPSRLGREPPTDGPDSAHWFPPRPPDEEPHIKPPNVAGQHLGSGRGMATVEQLIGQITEANVKASEAIGALANAKTATETAVGQLDEAKNTYGNALGAVIEARDLVAATMEQTSSATLADMLELLQSAIDDHLTPGWSHYPPAEEAAHQANHENDEATTNCQGAMEKGEQYIGNLMA